METIWAIVLVVVALWAIIASVKWAGLVAKANSIRSAWAEMADDYREAQVDGVIDDAEKARIGEHAMSIDATDIWQAMDNFVRSVIMVIVSAKKK
jgi:hypothetical protein